MSTTHRLSVTAALTGLGLVAGTAVGVIAISVVDFLKGGISGIGDSASFYPAAAMFGAATGAALGPIAGWTLMRRVPIWKAVAGTAIGTTAGVVVGYALARALHQPGLVGPIGGGVGGFLAAAVFLRGARHLPRRVHSQAG